MPIKKEYTVFSAEGYKQKNSFKDKKGIRYVSFHVRDAQSNVFLELTIDQAKEAIQDIEKAIKESKKNSVF
jgi:hypothetical protein